MCGDQISAQDLVYWFETKCGEIQDLIDAYIEEKGLVTEADMWDDEGLDELQENLENVERSLAYLEEALVMYNSYHDIPTEMPL